MAETFKLPDLGEGLTEADLVAWHVAEGDTVEIDQVIAEVETAKSVVEIPCPYEGTVLKVYGEPGQTLVVGNELITVGAAGEEGSADASGTDDADAASAGHAQSYREEEQAGSGSGNVLIGYGTSEDEAGSRRRRRGRRAAASIGTTPQRTEMGAEPVASTEVRGSTKAPQAPRVVNPLVRKLARENGIDVADLSGSGPDGLIMRADVQSAIDRGEQHAQKVSTDQQDVQEQAGTASSPAVASTGTTDARTGLAVASRTPMTGVRKVIAETMSRSRRQIPEATVWVDVDATDLLVWRKSLKPNDEGRVPSVLSLIGRFVTAGLMQVPELNSRIDEQEDGSQEIVQFDGVNLGIAAQTDRGLVVPAVADAQKLSARGLDAAIGQLIATARTGKSSPAELTRGTFTLNNYGVFNVDGSAAIINHPQVAIMGLGRIKERPWVVDGDIKARSIMELTLAFDHRVCDGGAASQFLRFVADAIENPAEALANM